MLKLDDLLEKSQEFELKGRVVKVTEMGLADYMKITAWVQKVRHKLPSQFSEKTNTQDVLLMIKNVSDEEAAELFSIILKIPSEADKKYIRKYILTSMRVMVELINLVCEVNGFEKTLETFQKASERLVFKKSLMNKQMTNSPRP